MIGATRGTGREVMYQALAAGYAVTALARRLEAAGRAGDLSGVGPLLDELESALAALDRDLTALTDPCGADPGGPTCAS